MYEVKTELEKFTPEQGREHFLAIGGQPNTPDEAVLQRVRPGATDHSLSTVPEDEEIERRLSEMRSSAGGDDEITVDMRMASEGKARMLDYDMVRKLWQEETWGEPETRAVVSLLWKKKGDERNLDNYRGVCLLTIITRLVAGLLARRLQAWAERNGRLVNQQFGFRARRST